MGITKKELLANCSPDTLSLSAAALAELDGERTITAELRNTGALGGAMARDVRSGAPTEHEEQVALFAWAEANEARWPGLANLFSVPNGGYRPMVTAAQLKAEGQKPGVPDCFLAVPRPGVNGKGYHGLFLELKRSDHSNHATPLQKEWIDRLRQWGYQAVICYGTQEAIDVIKAYLGIE